VRRDFIYPHRAVRALPITGARIAAAVLLAAVLSVLIVWRTSDLLAIHGRVCGFFLKLAGIPVTGTQSVEIFRELGSVTAPQIPFLSYSHAPLLPSLLVLLIGGTLAILFGRFPLSRGFAVFLATLVAAGVASLWVPHLQFDSVVFSQIWLRGESLVWILLPWILSFLFLLGQPSRLWGVGMLLSVPVFGFVWSACRLAFCLGAMHFLGTMLMPLLWFGLGLLADLLYVMIFYSVVLYQTSASVWGRRKA
jgi:hypothetical protein